MTFVTPAGTRLIRALGAGTVFDVALVDRGGVSLLCKRVKPRLLASAPALRALEREAEVLRRVRHASVPELVGEGRDDAGPWLLEVAAHGVPLRTLVEARGASGQTVPGAMLVALARRGFAMLAELHAFGDLELVHGDLSPDHLVVGPAARGSGAGALMLVDFGQARWRGMSPALAGVERSTLPFVAPEIARGEIAPDQPGDVFALAAVLAFAALGRDPCRSPTSAARLVEAAEQGVDLEALAATSLTERLRSVLLATLAFDRSQRVTSAHEASRLLSG